MHGIAPDTVHGHVPELLFATFQLTFADHHRRADQRRHRRPRQVRGLGGLRPGLDGGRLRPSSRTGCGRPAAGWSTAGRARLRGRHWSSRSSPAPPALALALVLGPRIGFKTDAMRPHNLPLRAARRRAAVVRLVRLQRRLGAGRQRHRRRDLPQHPGRGLHSACWAGWRWSSVRDGRPTTFGAASGVVAGLVAITPSCGNGQHARRAGGRPGRGHRLLVRGRLKFRLGYDDSLDVVGVHFVGGIVGTLLIGLLATRGHDRRARGPAVRRRARPSWASRRWRGRRSRRVRLRGHVRDRQG